MSTNGLSTDLRSEQVELIKRTMGKDLSDLELDLFLYQCRRTGLDPLSRQIYAVKRKGKLCIQTGIDGYQLIADRTDKYAGSDDATFDTETEKRPGKATVTVYKLVAGQRVPYTRSARWAEYFPGEGENGSMWRKMPFRMLAKCAEALALRAAFPQELSGIYTDEEMEQAGDADGQEEHPKQKPAAITEKPRLNTLVSKTQVVELEKLFAEREPGLRESLLAAFKIGSLEEIQAQVFDATKKKLMAKPLKQTAATPAPQADAPEPAPDEPTQEEVEF